MIPLTALSSFLAGYLHQDWDLEYASPSAAAADFSTSEPVELVIGALGELAMLNAVALDDAMAEAILRDAGCYYRPIDSPIQAWLIALEQEIGAALWSRHS